MKRTWPIIAVADVIRSSAWYVELLAARNNHPNGTVFDQILDEDDTILLCLHSWGPSGPNGDHEHPSLSHPEEGNIGKGLLLWFVIDDFDAAWERAQGLGAVVEEQPNTDNGTGKRAFVVRDPDGSFNCRSNLRERVSEPFLRKLMQLSDVSLSPSPPQYSARRKYSTNRPFSRGAKRPSRSCAISWVRTSSVIGAYLSTYGSHCDSCAAMAASRCSI